MKWSLDVERKDIELDIQKDMFVLETKGCEMQFDINKDIASRMVLQLRAIMQKPWRPEEKMVEHIDGKLLTMDFVLNSDNHWVMNLNFANEWFYAALTRKELERFSQVLGEYLESMIIEGC
jgi:hypothetical protein